MAVEPGNKWLSLFQKQIKLGEGEVDFPVLGQDGVKRVVAKPDGKYVVIGTDGGVEIDDINQAEAALVWGASWPGTT